VTTYLTPAAPRGGIQYFVVRARNAAGHEDTNTVEQPGVFACPAVNQPARG
jgi:hypothetical protein